MHPFSVSVLLVLSTTQISQSLLSTPAHRAPFCGTKHQCGLNRKTPCGNSRGATFVRRATRVQDLSDGSTDERYYSSYASQYPSYAGLTGQKVTLTRYLNNLVQEEPELREMEGLLLSVQMACKTISNLVNRAPTPTSDPSSSSSDESATTSPQFNSMKKLDELSTNVLRNALRFTGKLRMVKPAMHVGEGGDHPTNQSPTAVDESRPADHQPGVLIASALDSKYVAFFDPLDGSNNADAAICTGTIFGVFESKQQTKEQEEQEKAMGEEGQASEDTGPSLISSVLQPGKNLCAAGYCLYSSATILVFTIGNGTHMFTLDPQINEFVLTKQNMRIPQTGNIYSCNESNSEGWDDHMKKYIHALKSGDNESGVHYTSRYVGSMVGDIHRTLIYGGIFLYPSDMPYHPNGNLQLLYKTAPMAYVVNQAGGKSSNGKKDLLDVSPRRVHERQPCFIGSPNNIDELNKYMSH
mmetsp:Transcript_32718/g.48013  ORF Transcript_32718/g.48013 Transcript_32718/m.48013 type:complete len:468 (+) Transcript_32718:91-1494(+)